MKDIEEFLQTMDIENVKIPLNIETKIQYALSNPDSKRKENGIKKIVKFIVGIIITMVSTSGICFATVQIYNEYIKRQETINSRGLFDSGDGITNYETDLTQNDMKYSEESELLYKVITNMNDYQKYKERVNSLPEMTQDDFNTEFLLIMTWRVEREIHQTDLKVNNIIAEDNATYIYLAQKENANINSKNNIIYAVISKEKLKDNIVILTEHYKITNSEYTDVNNLPSDYSIEQAIQDGCVVIENNTLKSSNINKIDEFIANSENGENGYIRIYVKEDFDFRKGTYIHEIEYKDGVYYRNIKNITNREEKEVFNSYEKIEKQISLSGIIYGGISRKEHMKTKVYSRTPLITIQKY